MSTIMSEWYHEPEWKQIIDRDGCISGWSIGQVSTAGLPSPPRKREAVLPERSMLSAAHTPHSPKAGDMIAHGRPSPDSTATGILSPASDTTRTIV